MFRALIGDLFLSQAQTLVNTVNCVGIMGKGIAQKFKERYPDMFDDYLKRCTNKEVRLGEPYAYFDSSGIVIINFPTKNHWRSPSRLSDIEEGLDYFVTHYKEWGVKAIAFPPLGCGNGGLDWEEVGPLMFRKLNPLEIPIEVYAPYGTPPQQLSNEFLGKPFQLELEGRGRKSEKLNSEWVVVMEVLRDLERQPYANPVGRTIFQKICYVVTEIGVNTGFSFGKGSYGPFAHEVKKALHVFANRNWVHEQRLGRMLALRVSDQYEKERPKYSQVINQHRRKIDKAVDLFSRIKTTEQAEEVLTVLFMTRQLKKSNPTQDVAEQELLDHILDWKKRWRTEEKREALGLAIRNLVMLGWMQLKFSESLPDAI
jgi:O-acetyl-ADP-ribose deacetylase (regulator of RNase III)/uncharacterized protein YwgA